MNCRVAVVAAFAVAVLVAAVAGANAAQGCRPVCTTRFGKDRFFEHR